MPLTDDQVDREALLASVVAEFMEANDAGHAPDLDTWLSKHADLRVELEAYLAQTRWFELKTAPLRNVVTGHNAVTQSTFAGYELLEVIGQGGMGVVYRARQRQPARVVALKMIRAGRFATARERQRFLAEADAISRVDHPGIVPIYEVGEAEGRPYFTMKLIEGGNLAGHLPRLKSDPYTCVRLISELARAIHHAHQRGVLHRDLKPANVLLDAEDRPHASDFGLAHLADSAALTQTGELVGTPPYMAPEQTLGARNTVTTATDIYGLGAVLYACLTRRPPFDGGSIAATLDQVRVREPEAPSRENPVVPRDLDAICLKCLEKEPARRYASAGALADDLDRFRAGQPVRARRTSWLERTLRWIRRRPELAGLVALTLAAVIIGAWLAVSLSLSHSKAGAATRAAETQEFFGLLDHVRQRRVAPQSGWTVASLADLSRAAELVPATEHLYELRSEAADCLSAPDLRLIQEIKGDLEPYEVQYSPDGKLLALGGWSTQGGLGRVRLVSAQDGSLIRELTFPADLETSQKRGRVDGCRTLAFSPDGRWLVAGSRFGGLHRWDLGCREVMAISWRTLGTNHADIAFGVVRPLLFAEAQSKLQCWDITDDWKEVAIESAAEILTRIREPGETGNPILGAPAVDPVRGRLIYSIEGAVRLLDGKTLRLTRPMDPADWRVRNPAFGPDGRIVAWMGGDHLALGEADTGPLLQALVVPGGMRADVDGISQGAFHPSGSLFAATSEWSRHVKLWDVANGQLALDHPAGSRGSMRVALSPSGKTIAVAADSSAKVYEILGRPVLSTIAVQPFPVHAADLSRDGRWLACSARAYSGPRESREVSVWPTFGATALPSFVEANAFADGYDAIAAGPDACTAFTSSERNFTGNYLVYRTPHDISRSGLMARRSPRTKMIRFDADGRAWVVTGDEVRAHVLPSWDVTHRFKLKSEFDEAGDAYHVIAPGQRWTLAGQRNGSVEIIHVATGASATVVIGQTPVGKDGTATDWEPVRAICYDEVAGLAAAGTEKGRIQLFRVPEGTVVTEIANAHRDAVGAVALSPNGRLMATGGFDRVIRLWKSNGTAILNFNIGGPCTMLAFTPDGHTLFGLVSGERGVRRWNLRELAKEMREHGIDPGYEF